MRDGVWLNSEVITWWLEWWREEHGGGSQGKMPKACEPGKEKEMVSLVSPPQRCSHSIFRVRGVGLQIRTFIQSSLMKRTKFTRTRMFGGDG
eukprot:85121-Hanusia_phi.AAC.7